MPLIGSVDAKALSLPVLTLVLAGMDAFNPCAFFVLLFLLSLLVHAKSRTRMAIVGGTFVLFSGVVYFVFMAAWLNVFLIAGELRVITFIAGLVRQMCPDADILAIRAVHGDGLIVESELVEALEDIEELVRRGADGDLENGRVRQETRYLGELNERIRDVQQGEYGLLYVLTDSSRGRLLRLAPKKR